MNKIDMERLMYAVMDYYTENEQYYSTAKLPYTKFEGNDITEKLENKRNKLKLYNEWQYRAWGEIRTVAEVLKLDIDQLNRLYSAGRATRKWMQRTNYERCIPYDLQNRLEEYVFGKEKAI